jgi:hypothetical protein
MTATTDEATGKTDVAKDQASQVADATKQQASDVAATAKDQATQVAQDAKTHAQDLLSETTDQLASQANEQTQRLAGNLKELSRQLATMADAGEQGTTAHTLVGEAASRAGGVADYLNQRHSGEIVNDLTRFARRRPGAFILGSAVAGLVVGRLGRAAKDAPDAGSSPSGGASAASTGIDTTVAPMTAPGRSPVQFEEPAAVSPAELPELRR